MLEHHLRTILNAEETCTILQLNCRRSPHIMHSLFNHEFTNKFSILALQEPHVNRVDFLPSNQTNWTLISPTPTSLTEEARPRASLYVRKDLPVALNPISSESRDLATCTITFNNSSFLISNVYNAPRTFSGLEAWDNLMTTLPLPLQLLPTVVVMDSNLHSPAWNPPHNTTHDKEADSLIDLMSKWGLQLRSPAGEPTFGLGSSTTRGTTIDLVWVNKQLDETVQACLVDTEDITNHLSDHQSLITSFSTKPPGLEAATQNTPRKKNWHKVEIPTLLTNLMHSLPTVKKLTTQDDIDSFDRSLRQAITTALDKNSPNKAPPGKHKPWWRPEVLDPLRKNAKKDAPNPQSQQDG